MPDYNAFQCECIDNAYPRFDPKRRSPMTTTSISVIIVGMSEGMYVDEYGEMDQPGPRGVRCYCCGDPG